MALTKVGLKGLDDGTDGQVITYDANGNPVAVGPGNDGQVLTSTGAGSPPAFEDVPAGGATINNATENELVTVASTTSQLDAEANLTFDGSSLTLGGSTPVLKTNDGSSRTLELRGGSTTHNPSLVTTYASNLYLGSNSTESVHIGTEHLTITNGDLVIGTSGHGISFAATSDESGMTGELLDDYEEGTWTPIARNGIASPAYKVQQGYYIKVGHIVMANFIIKWGDCDTNGGHIMLGNVPYTPASSPHDDLGHGLIIYQTMENTAYGKYIQLSGSRMDIYSGYNNGWTISNGTNIEDMWIKGGVTYKAA